MKQAGEFIQQQVARDPRRWNAFIVTRYKGATTLFWIESVNRCVNELIARTEDAFNSMDSNIRDRCVHDRVRVSFYLVHN